MGIETRRMTVHTLGSEPKRIRTGLLVLAIGLVLSLWAWGSWILRTTITSSEEAVAITSAEQQPSPKMVQAARPMFAMLIIGLVLVLVFLVATYAIVRSSRRFRELIFRKQAPPTASDDVWAMHKAPPEDEEG